MKVVLFCGGMGTRLWKAEGDVPKPMVKIGYRPVLWHIMKYYAHFGHKEFILCLGYKADVIKNYFLNYNKYLSADFTMSNGGREFHSEFSDLDDWTIHFVDTGLRSNIGQRLRAVQSYIGDDDMFLANYADGLTNVDLNAIIRFCRNNGKLAGFLCVKPSQSFHVVDMGEEGLIRKIDSIQDSGMLLNAGYFVFRKEIFDYIKPGEELVEEPFERLISERQLVGYRHDKFWCMDTFKEHQVLNDMYNEGYTPWQVWNNSTSK